MITISEFQLKEDDFKTLITSMPTITLNMIVPVLESPDVLKVVLYDSRFIEILPSLRKIYMKNTQCINLHNYFDGDNLIHEYFDLLVETLDIYNNTKMRKHIFLKMKENHSEIINKLLDIGLDLYDTCVIHHIFANCSISIIERVIQYEPNVIYNAREDWNHPIMYALINKKYDVVNYLIDFLSELPEITNEFDILDSAIENVDLFRKIINSHKIRLSPQYNFDAFFHTILNYDGCFTKNDLINLFEKINPNLSNLTRFPPCSISYMSCIQYNPHFITIKYEELMELLLDTDLVPYYTNVSFNRALYDLSELYKHMDRNRNICVKLMIKIMERPEYIFDRNHLKYLPEDNNEINEYIQKWIPQLN